MVTPQLARDALGQLLPSLWGRLKIQGVKEISPSWAVDDKKVQACAILFCIPL